MENDKFIVYGGMRGGGKVFALEQMLAAKDRELEELRGALKMARDENKLLRDELMRISVSENPELCEKIIRINYLDLLDSNTAMRVLEQQLREFAQSFDRKKEIE